MKKLEKEEIIKIIGIKLYKEVSKKTNLEFIECGNALGVKIVGIMLNNKNIDVINSNRLETFLQGYMCALKVLH